MATHGDIGLSQPAASTITMKLRTVTQDLNSTVAHQEVVTIGGAESTLGLAQVLAPLGAPPSTVMGLVTRSFAYLQDRDSSNVAAVLGALPASTALGLTVRPVVPSTYAPLSKIADRDETSQTAAVLNAVPASTTYGLAVRPVGGGVDYTHDGALTVSTVAGPACVFRATSTTPSAVSTSDDAVWGAADLRGRQLISHGSLFPTVTVYSGSTAGQASTTQIAASNAALNTRVFAISVTSTDITQRTVSFNSDSNANRLWAARMSSGVMGFTLAVTPPAYLFSASTGMNLTFNVGSTSDNIVNVSYFQEP